MELVRLSPVLFQQAREPAQVLARQVPAQVQRVQVLGRLGRALAQVESARQASEPVLPGLEQVSSPPVLEQVLLVLVLVLVLVLAELARLVPEPRLPERGKSQFWRHRPDSSASRRVSRLPEAGGPLLPCLLRASSRRFLSPLLRPLLAKHFALRPSILL